MRWPLPLLMVWKHMSCRVSPKGAFEAFPEVTTTGVCPPLHKPPPGFFSPTILPSPKRRERRAIGPHPVFPRPPSEAIGRSRMVGEVTECLLERFKCVLARSAGGCGERDRKNLEGIPEFLAGDSELMDFVGRDELSISAVEEAVKEHRKPTTRIGSERLAGFPCQHRIDEPLDASRPIVGHERLANFLHRLAGDITPLGQHVYQPHTGLRSQRPSVLRLPIGGWPGELIREHVEVACGSGSMANFSEALFKPATVLLGHDLTKRRQSRKRAASRHAKLMHMLRVMPLPAGGPQFRPYGFQPLSQGAGGNPGHRDVPTSCDRPRH